MSIQTVKLKVISKFPATVTVGDGLTLTNDGGNYQIDLDSDLVNLATADFGPDESIYWPVPGSPTAYSLTATGRAIVGQATQQLARSTGLGLAGTTTDNTVCRFDGTTGLTQSSGVVISDLNAAAFGTGSVSSPSVSFVSDLDSGFYSPAPNQVNLALSGTSSVAFATTGVSVVGSLTVSTSIANGDGSVGAPAYSYGADPDTGWYRIGANRTGLSLGSATILDCATTGLTVTGTLTATTVAGSVVASQAQMEAGTLTNVVVVPARVKNDPGVAKAWIDGSLTGGTVTTLLANNCTATRTATGIVTIVFPTPFSTSSYSIGGYCATPSIAPGVFVKTAQTAGSCSITMYSDFGATPKDHQEFAFQFFGDQ